MKILVCVAWPYAAGPRHLGHAVSTFIPADIVARYHRMKGDEVLMVGGSDMHGTPTMVLADQEGVTPRAVAERYHAMHEKNIEQLGVRYDLYWNTADPHHEAWVQEIFLSLRDKGHVYEATMVSPFCTTDQRFLPDRYVEGTCPHCGFPRARGDQCENCGRILDPFELKDPKCKIHGTTPIPKETKHFFFRLSAFEKPLSKWAADDKEHWRHHVLTFARSWLREGLKDRPITRDLDWGIEVPVPGYESKRIYVWFEAVMGYLPATKDTDFEWEDFERRNNSELLAVYGNFVHRALTFADKNFHHEIPPAAFLDATDKAMIRAVEQQWKKVGQNLEYVHMKDAMKEAIQLARLGNQYVDQKAPWNLLKTDRAACGTAIHVALRVSRALAVIMAPFLPFSSPRLWHALGYDSDVHETRWEDAPEDVPAGQKLRVGKPLFSKIELGEPAADPAERFDVRVARIVDVKDHPNADKLYILEVDLGDERRQIVAGIRSDYTIEQLRGRKVALLANLEAAKLRGVESRGMLLAAEDQATVGLLIPPEDAAIGSQILGVKGAPTLPFSEFQEFKFQVGPGGTIEFRGRNGEVKQNLAVNGAPLRVDKDLKEGAWVH